MRDEIVEAIMDLCALYLKLGELTRSGGIVRTNKIDYKMDPVCDAVIFREEIWKRLLGLLQKIHRL